VKSGRDTVMKRTHLRLLLYLNLSLSFHSEAKELVHLFGIGCSTSYRVAHVLSIIMETEADGGSIDKIDVSGCQEP